MTLLKKTVSGSGEDLKAIKNAKNASKTAEGGTQRTSFTGSNDPRKNKGIGPNELLGKADGYVNDGPVTSDISDANGLKKTSGGPDNVTHNKRVTVSNEDITKGFGNLKANKSSKKFGS